MLRHTRMVSAMRLLLPSIAALVLGALALWSQFGVDADRFLLSMGALGPSSIESMNMANPRYEGIDQKKRPFIVTAKQATQVDSKGEIIDLAAPQADITMENGAWLSLNAEGGRFQRTAQLLDLTGAVNIFHDQGYEMHTRDLHVDLAAGHATGHQPVQGQGPAGDLTAEGIDVSQGGKRVLLLGRSHVVLYSTSQASSSVPAP